MFSSTSGSFVEMDEDSADDDKFSNIALCICNNAPENLSASEEELEHIQVRLDTRANTFCHCNANVLCDVTIMSVCMLLNAHAPLLVMHYNHYIFYYLAMAHL